MSVLDRCPVCGKPAVAATIIEEVPGGCPITTGELCVLTVDEHDLEYRWAGETVVVLHR